MQRKPRKSDEPLLSRKSMGWLGIVGLVMGISTLIVIWWADREWDLGTARTMGVTAFAIMNLFFSWTVRSDVRSVFSVETFNDRRFVITSGMSVAAIFLATSLDLFQRLLGTTSLDVVQWLICIGAALTVIVLTEIRKMVLRRRGSATPPATEPVPVPA